MQKLTELKSSQDSSNQNTLETDPLTILYGKDNRGRTRGVGLVSKSKLKAITPICSEIDKAVKRSNMLVEQNMLEIKQSIDILLRAYSDAQKCPPQPMLPQPSSLSNPSDVVTPSYPTPASSSSCNIFSVTNAAKNIATGKIVSMATTGSVVHGHVMLDYERKVNIIKVIVGEEEQVFYLESQGCTSTIKEIEGRWVVWPVWFFHRITLLSASF